VFSVLNHPAIQMMLKLKNTLSN